VKPARSRFTRDGDEELDVPLLAPLFDDMVESERLIKKADTQFARRAFVRAAFAFNEGFLFWFKDEVIHWVLAKGWQTRNLEIAKVQLLSDEMYKPDRRGKIESEPNRIPFLNFFAFVFRTGAECCDLDPAPLFSDNGWSQMQLALDVRHRITHPKKPEDLNITDDEMFAVSEGHRWMLNCLLAMLRARPGNKVLR